MRLSLLLLILVLGGGIAVSAIGRMMEGSLGSGKVGEFEVGQDVGAVRIPGSSLFDSASKSYYLTASGENIWDKQDAFHFLWRKMTGNVALSATIELSPNGKNPHRKAVLMIRQGLGADAAYADIAIHADGLTSLQYREQAGGVTHEVVGNVVAPKSVRLERRDDYVTASFAGDDGVFHPLGGAVRLRWEEPFYLGLGLCSHELDAEESATFSHVKVEEIEHVELLKLYSTLEKIDIASKNRKVVRVFDSHIEAPNWLATRNEFIYNSEGRLYRIPVSGGEPTLIDTGFAVKCNNDHGISPDGKLIVISDQSHGNHQSVIYTLPISGGSPKRVTAMSPSYWHGWSPDGKTLAYCAQREGKYGIFTIPVNGGIEKRLTATEGLDDGPDYSPDGKYIYFNGDRTGKMQIYRMLTTGGGLEQVTRDEFNNWFPHISPDGKWMVMLSYEPEVKGHPADKDVSLRLMELATGKVTTLAKFFGGQGTINVPSWSPDSRALSFVSYQYLP